MLKIQKNRTFKLVYPSNELGSYAVELQYGGEGALRTEPAPYSNDDGGYLATLTPTVTAALPLGEYRYEFVAIKTDMDGTVTESHTLDQGRAEVCLFVDAQNEIKWMYAALRAAQAALADFSDGAELNIVVQGGPSLSFETRRDLLAYISNLERTIKRHELDRVYGEAPVFVDLGDVANA